MCFFASKVNESSLDWFISHYMKFTKLSLYLTPIRRIILAHKFFILHLLLVVFLLVYVISFSSFHTVVTWDWSQISCLNTDTRSILLDIHVFTPKRPRTLFSFKPLGTNKISCHILSSCFFLSDLVLNSFPNRFKPRLILIHIKQRTDFRHTLVLPNPSVTLIFNNWISTIYVTHFSSIPYCRISEIAFHFKTLVGIQSSLY